MLQSFIIVLREGFESFLLVAVIAGAALYRRAFWPHSLGVLLACGAYMLINAQVRYLVDIMPLIASLAAAPLLCKVPAAVEAPPRTEG